MPAQAQGGGDLSKLLLTAPRFFLSQRRSWLQMLTSLEARNKYKILDESGNQHGWALEQGGGFMSVVKRLFLKSHRPFDIAVTDMNNQVILRFQRKFFFFFSDVEVFAAQGVKLGSAHRRFGILNKRYDLVDAAGQPFAHIKSSIFRIWTFKLFGRDEKERGVITKKWGGLVREALTDADRYLIDYGGQPWSPQERAVVFGTAISIDFDFFERNGGLISFGGG